MTASASYVKLFTFILLITILFTNKMNPSKSYNHTNSPAPPAPPAPPAHSRPHCPHRSHRAPPAGLAAPNGIGKIVPYPDGALFPVTVPIRSTPPPTLLMPPPPPEPPVSPPSVNIPCCCCCCCCCCIYLPFHLCSLGKIRVTLYSLPNRVKTVKYTPAKPSIHAQPSFSLR